MVLTIIQYIGTVDCIDSIDSIESEDFTDSIDSVDFIDSIDSILVPHKKNACTHTTHKEKMILPMGAAPKAPPPSVLSRVPFVCGVNVGDALSL